MTVVHIAMGSHDDIHYTEWIVRCFNDEHKAKDFVRELRKIKEKILDEISNCPEFDLQLFLKKNPKLRKDKMLNYLEADDIKRIDYFWCSHDVY